MNGPALELRLSLRLFFGGEKCFGPGPAALLEATDRLGSLRAAAAEADMAYSKAWTSLRSCEQALGIPLLEREAGGRRGGGSHLTREGREKAIATCKLLGLDAIVAIGGDGTFRGALALSRQIAETNQSLSVVGIPATIDNDIGCSHYTIGFDTACNTAVECIDKLRDTMQSHERCSVVEVMGRHAGHLALYVGIAVGATAVLIPERPVDFQNDVIENIRRARLAGTTHYMVVTAEGAASAYEVANRIKDELGMEPRVTVLGYIQRGGSPSARDRETASRMGYEAVQVLLAGKGNRIVATKDGRIVDLDMEEALQMKKSFPMERYQILEALTLSGSHRR